MLGAAARVQLGTKIAEARQDAVGDRTNDVAFLRPRLMRLGLTIALSAAISIFVADKPDKHVRARTVVTN
jgi:hypothetical protein